MADRDYQERPTPTHRTVEIDYVFVSRELVPLVTTEAVVDTGGLATITLLVVDVDLTV